MKKKNRRNFGRSQLNALKDEYELEKLVFRVFIKHIKDNNLYIAFRWSVNIDNYNRDIIHALSSKLCGDKHYHSRQIIAKIGCAFGTCRSVDDIIRMMHAERGMQKVENNAQFQLAIMNMVNMLIHNCVEYALVKNMQLIEKIGSSIFEEVGKKLFGNDFKDMTEEAMNPQQREFMERMQEMNGEIQDLPQGAASREFFRVMRDRLRMEMEMRRRRREEEEARPSLYFPYSNLNDENIWDDTF